jgi:hypothetical protein
MPRVEGLINPVVEARLDQAHVEKSEQRPLTIGHCRVRVLRRSGAISEVTAIDVVVRSMRQSLSS